MKLIVTIGLLLCAWLLPAQTCTYYNKYGDKITVDAKVLPINLDTNFMKAHVLFEDLGDTSNYRTYNITQIEPWALRTDARKYVVRGMNHAKYGYYFLRTVGGVKSKHREMDTYELMSNYGGKGGVLIVNKKTLAVEVKYLYMEI